MSEAPYTGAGRKPFSWAEIGENTICLNVGGDITLTHADEENFIQVALLGNANASNDSIPNLIELLQRQMNCVRGI
jgi:hypothetical protein